ncbi:MAG: glyoxalase [Cryomorphaceae bacterium BACL22 MAG-120619-bin32]|jgi:hypothetical protein|nr:MAG: glyoxalase [Cryomorphaceae bacterium BACL22 MAG-120619-bin32]
MNKERPIISYIVNENTLDFEKFQNASLRPIIKMQDEFIFGLFQGYLSKRKIDFNTINISKRRAKAKSIFLKDLNFKYLILGVIIGHFSSEELQIYQENASEFNKRIIQICIQRVQDTFIK